MSDTAASPVTLDPIIPRSLMESIQDAFRVQAQVPIEVKKTQVTSPGVDPGGDVVAMIGIRSKSLEGTLALCLPKATFLGVVNHMLGENYAEVTAENADAASELLNIIYGGARVKINEAGHDFEPAIPTVVKGSDVMISHGAAKKIVRIDCDSGKGPFHVEISLRQARAAA